MIVQAAIRGHEHSIQLARPDVSRHSQRRGDRSAKQALQATASGVYRWIGRHLHISADEDEVTGCKLPEASELEGGWWYTAVDIRDDVSAVLCLCWRGWAVSLCVQLLCCRREVIRRKTKLTEAWRRGAAFGVGVTSALPHYAASLVLADRVGGARG